MVVRQAGKIPGIGTSLLYGLLVAKQRASNAYTEAGVLHSCRPYSLELKAHNDRGLAGHRNRDDLPLFTIQHALFASPSDPLGSHGGCKRDGFILSGTNRKLAVGIPIRFLLHSIRRGS